MTRVGTLRSGWHLEVTGYRVCFMQGYMDCFTILIIGVVAFFALTIGFLALGLFGLGAIVWGVVLLPQNPLAGILWIALGVGICSLFGQMDRGRPW